jgi:hypothetical protein
MLVIQPRGVNLRQAVWIYGNWSQQRQTFLQEQSFALGLQIGVLQFRVELQTSQFNGKGPRKQGGKYRINNLERVTGIEPAWPAWKAGALPLSYTRGCMG